MLLSLLPVLLLALPPLRDKSVLANRTRIPLSESVYMRLRTVPHALIDHMLGRCFKLKRGLTSSSLTYESLETIHMKQEPNNNTLSKIAHVTKTPNPASDPVMFVMVIKEYRKTIIP